MHCGNGTKKREAKEVPEHNSYISSKSSGKALPARAALEFLPFATGGSGAKRLIFFCCRFTQSKMNSSVQIKSSVTVVKGSLQRKGKY